MGMFYVFHCPHCDPPRTHQEDDLLFGRDGPPGVPLGCGLRYPYVCKSIHEEIRAGKMGPEAQNAMRWIRKPGIYQYLSVHVCEDCEKWRVEHDIKVCRLKRGKSAGGSSLDRDRDRQAGPRLYPLCVLDPEIWKVVWEPDYRCSSCGGKMRPLVKPENLKCNRCGSPLEVTLTGHWD